MPGQFYEEVTQLRLFARTTPTLRFTLRHPPAMHGNPGEPWDLTDATITFDAKAELGDTTKIFGKTVTITNATGGKCEVKLAATDLDYDGILTAELEVVYPGGDRYVRQFQLLVERTVGE